MLYHIISVRNATRSGDRDICIGICIGIGSSNKYNSSSDGSNNCINTSARAVTVTITAAAGTVVVVVVVTFAPLKGLWGLNPP
jgi:hypothetical protein